MYSDPDSVSRLTMPLNAATSNSRLALARNRKVTGSSALSSNLKVISHPTPRAPADAPSGWRFSFAQQTQDARARPPFDIENSPRLSPHASAYRYLRVGQYCDLRGSKTCREFAENRSRGSEVHLSRAFLSRR